MDHKEIVQKLIGNIRPQGETNIDNINFENLKVMCELVNELVREIDAVGYDNRDAHEYSIKRAADYANDFLKITLGITD